MTSIRSNKRRIYKRMGYQIAGRPITNTRKACNAFISRFQEAAHKVCEAWAGLSRALTRAATRITNDHRPTDREHQGNATPAR